MTTDYRFGIQPAVEEKLIILYQEEKYKELIDEIDGIFGWAPGEVKHPDGYTQKTAYHCLTNIVDKKKLE